MFPFNLWLVPIWVSVFLSGGIAVYLFLIKYKILSLRLFGVSLSVWTLWQFLSLQWLIFPYWDITLRLSRVSLGILSIYSPLLIIFSLCFGRKNYSSFLKKWKIPISLFFIISIVLLLSVNSHFMVEEITGIDTSTEIVLGFIGKISLIFLLIAFIISLLNFESMLRYAKEMHRQNIKFFVWGITGFIYANIVVIGYAVLYSSVNFYQLFFQSIATIGLLFLFLFSVPRKRIESTEVYVGREAFQGSVTMITVGILLLVIGILGRLIPLMKQSSYLVYIIVGLFVLVFVIPILIAFGSIKKRVSIFVERLFSKSKYDYRKEWKELSDKLSSAFDIAEIANITLDAISEVTPIESSGIFLWDEFVSRFYMVENRNIPNPQRYFEKGDGFLDWLWRWGKPLEVSSLTDKEKLSDDYQIWKERFNKMDVSLVLPLITRRELIGLVVLGAKTDGEPFTFEDFDILETIANQASIAITHAKMSESMAFHKQMFSFHRVSSFVLHDVKNAAHSLSLAIQNAKGNIHKPEFQKDLLQTISRATERMNNIMTKLSGASQEAEFNIRPNNLNKLIEEIVAKDEIQNNPSIRVNVELTPLPLVMFDYEAMQKVLYNLIKNAVEVMDGEGEIKITTKQEKNYAEVMVSDTGAGMSQEFINTKLFRPFQTTKKKGLGIGLYQSKLIVDAHKGALSAESAIGKGTTFTVRLPVSAQ